VATKAIKLAIAIYTLASARIGVKPKAAMTGPGNLAKLLRRNRPALGIVSPPLTRGTMRCDSQANVEPLAT